MFASGYVEMCLCVLYVGLIIHARFNFHANGIFNKAALWVEEASAMGMTPFVAFWYSTNKAYNHVFWLSFFTFFCLTGVLTGYNWLATAFSSNGPLETLRSAYDFDRSGSIAAAISCVFTALAYVFLSIILLLSVFRETDLDFVDSANKLMLAAFPVAAGSSYFIMLCMLITNRKLDADSMGASRHDLLFRLCATEKAVTCFMIGICPAFADAGDSLALGFCLFWGAICQPTNHFAVYGLMNQKAARELRESKAQEAEEELGTAGI